MGVRRGVDRVIRLGRARGEFDADKGGGVRGESLGRGFCGRGPRGKGWEQRGILYINS